MKWDKGMVINPDNKSSYTTQYQEAFRKIAENEYCAQQRPAPVTYPRRLLNTNLVSFIMATRSSQSVYDSFGLSCNDEEYIMTNMVAETTPGQSYRAARILITTSLYFNSPSELPQNWSQIIPNLDNNHSDPMEICSTLWLPDITDRWRQQDKTY
jgi:hypothetical protein